MVMKLYAKEFFQQSNQSLSIEPRSPQDNFPEHTHHDFDEIVIVTEGTGRHILNDYPHPLYAGMVLYVAAQDHHLYENVENLHLTNILFRSTENFRFLHNMRNLLTALRPQHSCYQLIGKKHLQAALPLISTLAQTSRQSGIQQESQLFQLLSILHRNQFAVEGSGSNEEKSKQMFAYLRQNFTQSIDWQQLAAQFSLSLRTLHRYIKNNTGYSPQHYLTKLRLAEAYYQIRYCDKTITDIAYDCGFNDSSYFSTCFKQEFQRSPREFRAAEG